MTFKNVPTTSMMPYQLHGPPSEIPIVLVPGGLSGWFSWKPHAEILSQEWRGIRVQLLNMDAAERDQSPGDDYSLRSESTALRNTLDSLNLSQVHLVGWSHGGAVSLDFALNNPERIKTLTLIEPAAYWIVQALGTKDSLEEEEHSFKEFLSQIHDPVTEDDLIKFLYWNDLVPPGRDPRSLPQWPVWNKMKRALLSLHTVMEHTDDPARLQELHLIPIMLVKGRDSKGASAKVVDALAKALDSRTKVLVLPDGHACHIVAKDEFIAALISFMRWGD